MSKRILMIVGALAVIALCAGLFFTWKDRPMMLDPRSGKWVAASMPAEQADFILRVNIWPCSPGTEPQQANGRDFGSGVSPHAVTRKTTDDDQSACP